MQCLAVTVQEAADKAEEHVMSMLAQQFGGTEDASTRTDVVEASAASSSAAPLMRTPSRSSDTARSGRSSTPASVASSTGSGSRHTNLGFAGIDDVFSNPVVKNMMTQQAQFYEAQMRFFQTHATPATGQQQVRESDAPAPYKSWNTSRIMRFVRDEAGLPEAQRDILLGIVSNWKMTGEDLATMEAADFVNEGVSSVCAKLFLRRVQSASED